MSLRRRIVPFWRKRRAGVAKLRDCEASVIESVKTAISPRAWSAVQEQIGTVSRIHRSISGKQVTFCFDEQQTITKWLIPSPFEAWPIAVAYCGVRGGATAIRATVWIVSGRISDIIFSEVPSKISSGEMSVISAERLFDPVEPTPLQEARTVEALTEGVQIVNEIEEIAASVGYTRMRPPLPDAIRERFLVPVRDCIPLDFVKLLQGTNGFSINGWNVPGLPLQEVAMDGHNLFVLADSAQPYVLCAMDGDSARRAYLFDLEDMRGVEIGDSCCSALLTKPPARGT